MSVAAFYEGKARGETDEKYRVLGLAQLADFHAASSVPESWNLICAGAPKGRRNGQNGLFSSRFFTWLANSIGLARCCFTFLDTTPSGTYAEHPRKIRSP